MTKHKKNQNDTLQTHTHSQIRTHKLFQLQNVWMLSGQTYHYNLATLLSFSRGPTTNKI